MKQFFLFCFLAFCFSLNAQEMNVITETFDDNNNRFYLPEFYHKKYSAAIKDGFYEIKGLKNPKKQEEEDVIAKLPIDVERNFKVTFKFLIPNFKKKSVLLIGTNNVEYMLSPKELTVLLGQKRVDNPNELIPKVEKLSIILDNGKNKEILVAVEKKGRNTKFYVNEMEVYSSKEIIFVEPNFGFGNGCNVLKIDEIKVEQREED